jgi:ABC-type Fe3+/spermidine/putrescine transport system ATPase subunit
MPSLVLKQLTCTFGALRAVDNVDLAIANGEFLALLGPSGCGKTTTLRMIAGFIDPTAGSIEVDGRVLSSPAGSLPSEKRGMSMIFQSYAIWPNMTVAQNVMFGLEIRRLPKSEIDRRVTEVLETVQMAQLRERYPAELSGGQQQRVALARAVVVQPTVLLLDEPLSNLDANLREEMRAEIRRLHDAFKITTVYVTHDQAEAMATADRIAVMNKGRVEQVDEPYKVYAHPKTRFVAGFIGRTNFIEGKRNGSHVTFDGFEAAADRFERLPADIVNLTFSIRPQSLRLLRAPHVAADTILIEGRIVQRTFLGEHWDYVFAPSQSCLRLKVSARPSEVFIVEDPAWLALDPRLMVVVQ